MNNFVSNNTMILSTNYGPRVFEIDRDYKIFYETISNLKDIDIIATYSDISIMVNMDVNGNIYIFHKNKCSELLGLNFIDFVFVHKSNKLILLNYDHQIYIYDVVSLILVPSDFFKNIYIEKISHLTSEYYTCIGDNNVYVMDTNDSLVSKYTISENITWCKYIYNCIHGYVLIYFTTKNRLIFKNKNKSILNIKTLHCAMSSYYDDIHIIDINGQYYILNAYTFDQEIESYDDLNIYDIKFLFDGIFVTTDNKIYKFLIRRETQSVNQLLDEVGEPLILYEHSYNTKIKNAQFITIE